MRIRRIKEYASDAALWPSQLSSYRPGRPQGWRGRPCAFPELLSSFWDRAAVEICSAAAAADPHGSPHRPDRPASRQRHQEPHLWPRPRWWWWLATSARSRVRRPRRWRPRAVCGGNSSDQRAGQGWRGEASGQGGAGRRAHGGRSLKLAGGGKDRPLTRVRRAEKSSGLSSFSSRGSPGRRPWPHVEGCRAPPSWRQRPELEIINLR